MHDASFTNKYVILNAMSLEWNTTNFFKKGSNMFKFNKNKDAVYYVFDRSNGDLISKISTFPHYGFHFLNA